MTQEQIAVPNIGDSHDVDVVEILVKPGMRVEREQPLIVLESEKASMDIPSPQAGVVKELKVKVGDKVSEGSPILVLDLDGESEGAESKPAQPAAQPKAASAAQPAAASEARPAAQPKAATSGAQPSAAAKATSKPSNGPSPAAAAKPAAASGGVTEIKVPNIGDSHDVDVVEILVKAGARVEREQPLIVLESEKASMDIPSSQAGLVKELKLKVGDKVSEGAVILLLEVEAGAAESSSDRTAPAPAPSAGAKSAPETDRSAGEESDTGDDSAEREANSGTGAARPSEAAASPDRPAANGGGTSRTQPPVANLPALSAPPPAAGPRLPYASPAVRRFARELGADLSRIDGTARAGRITKDDVQRYVKQALKAPSAPSGGLQIADAPEIDFSQFGEIELAPLTKIQRLSGRNLHRSWVTIPHVTQFDEADITELEEFRKKTRQEQPELKLTLVTFFMKALTTALKAMPRFNASLDKSGENLILKHYFHIGVAVDTPNGLVVPVIRDVDQKSLGQLAKELETTSERARARKLSMSDLQGASMTISSLGGIGGTAFTPIINPPEVAVLGVSRSRWAPVYRDGAFVPRLLCPLSLSYDHRVIDGAAAARFTARLGAILGDIRQMLL
jgi:pyruvate dehydrogenase E2 component (dihydrolipoamide acetyltransferase)